MVHQPKTRTQRTAIKVDMDLATLLETYLDTKPELQKKKESLIEKALQLKNEITQQELN